MNNILTKVSKDKYPQCNLCLSKEDVFEVRKKGRTYVFEICKNCIKEIYNELSNLEEDEKS